MTSIEWTHRPGTKGESWNPIRARNLKTGKVGWHCTHASDGCRFCYAERLNLNRRGLAFGTGLPYKPGHEQAAGSAEGATGAQRDSVEIFLDEKTLAQPLRWRQPRTIFVCSMTDLFGAFVPDAMIDRVFAIAALCPQHTFIVLTKRSARAREYLSRRVGQPISPLAGEMSARTEGGAGRSAVRPSAMAPGVRHSDRQIVVDRPPAATVPLPNVWLGVSAERQQEADARIPDLLATPAVIRFVSLEPLLGPIDLDHIHQEFDGGLGHSWESALNGKRFDIWSDGDIGGQPKLNWVIVGGESGPDARPMHPDWARALRDQCAVAGVPFFFKQWGSWASPGYRPEGAKTAYYWPIENDKGPVSWKISKKAAGRTLDGVEHNAWPSSPLEGEDRAAPRAARLAALGEG